MKKKKIIISVVVLSLIVIAGLIWFFAFYLPSKDNKQYEQYYQYKLKMYEEENALYDDYEVDVVFLGDSLTDGYNLNKYYPDYLVSNRGISGDTTFGLEGRLKVSAYDLKPKVIVMLIGVNNIKSMFDNYENILIGLKENLPDTKVALVSLTPMSGWLAHNNDLACINNAKIEILASKYGYEYINLFNHMFDMNTNKLYEEYTNDGLHFVEKGYEVITSVVTPVIDALLG